MEQPKEKRCENCRYFLLFYTKRNLEYHAIYLGYCTKQRVNKKAQRKPDNVACELWETYEIRQAERKAAIRNSLMTMAKDIRKIAVILQADEDTTAP